MKKFLIVDDHSIVRQGLMHLLTAAYPGCVYGEAQNTSELFKQLHENKWDLLVLDITLPGRSGLEALQELRPDYPKLPVLVLTAQAEDIYASRVLKAGADGFMNKESAAEELVNAVRKLLGGGKYISPALAERLAFDLRSDDQKELHERLSDREYQVLCLIASGKTVSEIAESLLLSPKTISTYRARILEKMNMKTNAELTHYAIYNRLVD